MYLQNTIMRKQLSSYTYNLITLQYFSMLHTLGTGLSLSAEKNGSLPFFLTIISDRPTKNIQSQYSWLLDCIRDLNANSRNLIWAENYIEVVSQAVTSVTLFNLLIILRIFRKIGCFNKQSNILMTNQNCSC